MSEEVVLKGNRFGVQLVFDETVDFALVLQKLKHKLNDAKGFFGKGTTFLVSDKVSNEQREALQILLSEFELNLSIRSPKPVKEVVDEVKEMPEPVVPVAEPQPEVKIIRGTLRSGQEVVWDGSIVVFGNVNPGARIVAGGNIVIKGVCRGIVHAGAHGDRKATVTADKMMPGQIRIADIIACAPDKVEDVEKVECAKIKDNNIVIEPVEQREVS